MLYISHRIERHYCFSAWSHLPPPRMVVRDSPTPSLHLRQQRLSTACELDVDGMFYFTGGGLLKADQLREMCLWRCVCACVCMCACVCACHRPVEGGVPASHSWVTARAQEMSQKVGSWSPEGHPEDGLGSMTNSQVESSYTHTPRTTHLTTHTHHTNKIHLCRTPSLCEQLFKRSIHSTFVFNFMSLLLNELPKNHWGHLNGKMNYDLHAVTDCNSISIESSAPLIHNP